MVDFTRDEGFKDKEEENDVTTEDCGDVICQKNWVPCENKCVVLDYRIRITCRTMTYFSKMLGARTGSALEHDGTVGILKMPKPLFWGHFKNRPILGLRGIPFFIPFNTSIP